LLLRNKTSSIIYREAFVISFSSELSLKMREIKWSREILQVIENKQNVLCVKFLTAPIENSHDTIIHDMEPVSNRGVR